MRNYLSHPGPEKFDRAIAIAFATLALILSSIFSTPASADPPSRVARLGYASGTVSFSPAGEHDWVKARINRPLTIGDRLWLDRGARAELQVGNASIRLGRSASAKLLNLDDRTAQLQLTQGTLNVRVRRLPRDHVFEIDTPNLAFTIRAPGLYRIEVDPDGDATTVTVRSGRGEVFGDSAAYLVDSGQSYRFVGTDLRDYEFRDIARLDEFDRWSNDRDRLSERSISARYVSSDVIGYEDLDNYGTWRVVSGYGNVWTPTRVSRGWSPYRDGHWAWVDPWGWTWVDDAPWGFAPSHYGRWANMSGTWGWIPGPVRSRAVYAPALVAFIGGRNFSLSISSGGNGGIGWFPLGPREVYRPSYPVSRGYFDSVNTSNTVINNTQITNVYNNTNITNITYANREVPGAIIAVPASTFVQSKPVASAAVRVSGESVARAPVMAVAEIAPMRASVSGGAAPSAQPPAQVLDRAVVARTAPPPPPPNFAAQEQQLAVRRGQPLEATVRAQLKPAAVAQGGDPVVRVVPQAQNVVPAPPPAIAPGGLAPEQRGRGDQRNEQRGKPLGMQRGQDALPQNPPPAAPPMPVAPQPEQRGKPPAMPVTPQQNVAPAQIPQTQAPEGRSPAEQRGRGELQREQRSRPLAAPAAPLPAPAPAEQRRGEQAVVPDRGQEQQRQQRQQQQAQEQLRQQQLQNQQRQQEQQAQEQQRQQQRQQQQAQEQQRQQSQEQQRQEQQRGRGEQQRARPEAPPPARPSVQPQAQPQPQPQAQPQAAPPPAPLAKPGSQPPPPQQEGERRGPKGKKPDSRDNDKRTEEEKQRDEEEQRRKR